MILCRYMTSSVCKYCTHSFSQKKLRDHENQCHKNPLYIFIKCDRCSKKMNLVEYEQHAVICGAKYYFNTSIMFHSGCESESEIDDEIEESETYTYCEFCSKAVCESAYDDHTKRCRKNPLNLRVPCPYCNEELASDLVMKHTVFCTRNPDNMRVNCNGCNSRVKLRRYRDHLKDCTRITNKVISHRADECAICLCEITKNEIPKSLPCYHIFHDRCIADWSKKQNICPLCRAKIH